MKKCSRCKVEKELTEFHKKKTTKDGLINNCKSCVKEYSKKHYQANKEQKKEYYQANKEHRIEQVKEYKKKYYQSNKEKIKEYQKAKIALRKHLLDNKEQVRLDLERMRKISTGIDMSSYIENLSNSFSIENISIEKEKRQTHYLK